FLFSANPGEPLKPLAKVASGGELSRIMLALKNILADVDSIPVLIFDEIDAGVGGRTAESVGMKLKRLSKTHQVICITHLPQIASAADFHIMTEKSQTKDSTSVKIKELTPDERMAEIARMLSGKITDVSLKHASELLERSA
ncbi:MAG: DNA repair protein RecN, partial [Nitrospirota bacterium]|nr:DNA repair protein RecN [Nitrospirota bacterium]